MHTTRLPKVSAVAAIAVIALTACGSSGVDAADNTTTPSSTEQQNEVSENTAVFDFTEQSMRAMSPSDNQELVFQVHPELIEADQEYRDHRVLESVTVRSTEHPDAQCAVEVSFEYAEGAKEMLESETFHSANGQAPKAQEDAAYPAENPEEAVKFTKALGGAVTFGGKDTLQQDNTVMKRAVDCAINPQDTEDTVSVEFRSVEWVDSEKPGKLTLDTETLAEVDLSVMANGDLSIVSYDIRDWQQDANGTWIAK